MTDGTSQGLFIVVAIVIFGIFTLMAYILFEDTLSPALASMFNDSIEKSSLEATYGNQFDYEALVPDKHLQRAIRDRLNLPEGTVITKEILERTDFKDLAANVSGSIRTTGVYNYKRGEISIKSLEGLQYATNLTSLYLHGNRVESLEPIAGLTKLVALNINMNTTVSDITPLKGLVNITNLMLQDNPITDLTPLKNMNKLAMLNIGAIPANDLSVLAQIPSITELYIPRLHVDNVDFLSSMTKLSKLDIINLKVDKPFTIPAHVSYVKTQENNNWHKPI